MTRTELASEPEPAESVVGMLAEALRSEGFRVVGGAWHSNRPEELARNMLTASPALRARLAVAPDVHRETLTNIMLAAKYGQQAMAMKQRGGREKLAYIERLAKAALLATPPEPKPASPAVEGE